MSEASETPEDRPREPLTDETVTSQEVTSTESSVATRSPWLWLAAGLVAAILVPIVVQTTLTSFQVPLPAEFQELAGQQSGEASAEADQIAFDNKMTNLSRFLLGPGVVMSLVFGIFAGVIFDRIPMGIVGGVVGSALTFLFAMTVGPFVIDLETKALARAFDGDIPAMFVHSVQWILFGLAAVVAVLIGSGRLFVGLKALGAMLLASILGAVVYVIFAAVIDPANSTSRAIPVAGSARYLWTSVPPLLAGLFLSRTRRL